MSGIHSVDPLTRDEWHALIEAGALGDENVELLGGRRVAVSPEGRQHLAAVTRLAQQLRAQLDAQDFQVSEGHPIALSDVSEPEPDLAVIRGEILEILGAGDLPRPVDVALVIEVAHASLTSDLGEKADLYRAAGIVRYLVVDLVAERFVLHEGPSGPAEDWAVRVSAMDEPLEIDIGVPLVLDLASH